LWPCVLGQLVDPGTDDVIASAAAKLEHRHRSHTNHRHHQFASSGRRSTRRQKKYIVIYKRNPKF
ncbi:unnamed protein product, partial [Oikopleura dioica]